MPVSSIAIVNDDQQYLKMMSLVLEEEGYGVSVHHAEGSAFAELRQVLPDLVVLDIRMDTPDAGWNLLEMLMLEPSTRHIPVIICSAAHEDLSSKEEYLAKQGVSVLPKPFPLETLLDLVQQRLASSQQARSGDA